MSIITDPPQKVETTFAGASNPRLVDQLKTLMGNVDYLCLADIHSDIETHAFLANSEVVKAFADTGTKTFRLEALDLDAELIISAGVRGEIPFEAISIYLHRGHITDNIGGKAATTQGERETYEILPTIAKIAHKNGITLRSLDRGEGLISPELTSARDSLFREYAEFVIEKIKNTPDFLKLDQTAQETFFTNIPHELFAQRPDFKDKMVYVFETQGTIDGQSSEAFAARAFADIGLPIDRAPTAQEFSQSRQAIVSALNNVSKATKPYIDKTLNATAHMDDAEALQKLIPVYFEVAVSMDVIERRLELDSNVGKRILADAKDGEKEVIVYGAGHFGRAKGDIDDILGSDRSAVLKVSNDIGADLVEMSDYYKGIEHWTNLEFKDSLDYTLDLSKNEWTNTATGKTVSVEIPESLKPEATPTPEPNSTPPPQTPGPHGGC